MLNLSISQHLSTKNMALSMLLLCVSIVDVSATEELPLEVENYILERDLCEHFSGEDNEPRKDEDDTWIARREYVRDSIILHCSGTDRKLQILKKRFREQGEVMERLNSYEGCVGEHCD